MADPRIISVAEWESAKKHGYTHTFADGGLGIIANDPKSGGTILERVTVESSDSVGGHWMHRPLGKG